MLFSPQILSKSGRTGAAPGGGGGYSPITALSGLIGWWDASVAGSYSFSSGVNVSTWADQSGAGNTLSFGGTIFGRPTYNATGFNTSYPATMVTTAVGSALQNTSFAMGTGNTLTFFFVSNLDSANSNTGARLFSYIGTGATNDFNDVKSWTVNRETTSTTQMQFTRNGSTVFAGTANANHRIIGTINSSGVQTIYVDGSATTLATVSGNWSSPGTLQLGRNVVGNGSYWGGPIAECGIATGFTNSTDVAALDSYLQTKWGL